MATFTFDQHTTPRLNSISEELHTINTQIVANLEELEGLPDLVARLIGRCDDIALELDAIMFELGSSKKGSSTDQRKSPGPSADGTGLKP